MKDPCRMSKRDRHGNDQYYMASSQRPAHTAECRILLGLVCSTTRLHGVTDLRSGPRPKQGVVCEVPSGRTTAGGGFGLASRRSPKDSNQSVFLMIRPHPGASYSDLGYQTSGARLAGLGEVPGPGPGPCSGFGYPTALWFSSLILVKAMVVRIRGSPQAHPTLASEDIS